MESTANHSASSLGTAIATAAIAFGVGYLAVSSVSHEGLVGARDNDDNEDTTDYLLSGGNRDYLLAAIERRKQGVFISHSSQVEWQ